MKNALLIPACVAVMLMTGCATRPQPGCTVLEFNHAPGAATQTALLATTHGTTPAELAAWFNRGERGFVINTPDNAAAGMALALALRVNRVTLYRVLTGEWNLPGLRSRYEKLKGDAR